jgi:hypothetical protein
MWVDESCGAISEIKPAGEIVSQPHAVAFKRL